MTMLKQNFKSDKCVELWAKSMNDFGTSFLLRDIGKKLRRFVRDVPQAMAQFVLKIEKLSHIIGTAPILEMARPYGLRPRLWLLA